MAGIELAQAWVTISPRTKGMQKEIDKQLKGIESKGEKTGGALGAKISSGMKSALKAGAVTAGATAAAALGTALKKGFDRLSAIEQAKVKFEALGHTAKEQASLMDDVTAAVKGTAFSTSEAADAAAMALAGGIKPGKELTGVLKTIGDSSSFANKSFAEVAPIYTKAINSGKVMGDTLEQLGENAIPATAALAKHMGKSSAEIQKMASEGKISFWDLQKAMDATIGGQALKAGDTFSGSLANIGAAWARVGETILNTPFEAAPKIFGRVSDGIDSANEKLKGFITLLQTGDFTQEIGVQLAGGDEQNRLFEDSAMVNSILNFREKAVSAIDTVKRKWSEFQAGFRGEETTGMFGRLGHHFGVLAASAQRMMIPLSRVAASLGEAGLTASMVSLLAVLEALTPVIDHILVPALEKLSVLMVENQGAVTALVTAFVGLHTAKAASGALGLFTGKAQAMMAATKAGAGVVQSLGGAMLTSWKYAGQAAPGMSVFGKATMIMGANVKAAGAALLGMSGPLGMAARGVRLLGLAIRANPIGAIVTGVAAAVAALTWFFTKTETGKKVWASFMAFLRPIVAWMANAFRSLGAVVAEMWDSKIKPALSAFANFARIVATVIGTVLITPIILGWKALSAKMKYDWEHVIKPAWAAMVSFAKFMWHNVLSPIFGWIKTGWQIVATAIRTFWQTQILPTWNTLNAAARFMWANVLNPIFNAIKATWHAMANGIKWVWQNIILTTWNALKTALQNLYNTVIKPIFQWIGDRWRDMARVLGNVTSWIITNVFNRIGDGLRRVRGWFSAAVDAIRNTWDRVANIARKPIAFVVTTVFNEGIRKAWNAVADFVGLKDKKLNPLPPVAAYAKGGVLPGYTPGRDVHDFYSPTGGRLALSGGEAIMRPEWTRAVGGPAAVEEMNRKAKNGALKAVSSHGSESKARFADGGVLKFASGGVIEAMTRIVQKKYPMLQMTSGLRPGDGGMHGSGLAADFSNGGGNTPEQLSLARDIAKAYPGSAELIYDSPGWAGNIKNGSTVGPFGSFYTMAQAGPHHHHVHWAMTTPPTMDFGGGVFKGGSAGGGGGGFNPIAAVARAAWDKVMSKVPKFEGDAGPWTAVPGAFMKKAAGAVWNFVSSKLPFSSGGSSGNGPGSMGKGVERWRGLVEKILTAKGHSTGLADTVLRRMNQESGGDPGAINNWDVNAVNGTPSKGLMQVIDPTFQANKDPGYDDIWDPEANIRASMNYAIRRYGSLPAAYDRPGGYDNGGWLKPMKGTQAVYNHSGKPEPVFTHAQWATLKKAVLSNEQWAHVARPMVDKLEKLANDGREKREAQRVKVDGEVTTVDAEPVDPRVIGAQIAAGLVEGQLDDALGVFGLPSLGEIPAVKAAIEANKAVVDAGGASDPRAEALEGGVEGAFVNAATSSVVAEHMARMAPGLVGASVSMVSAAASGNPVAMARAAGNAADTVNITVASTQRAFSEYRKMQAKRSAGSRGVR